jgi:hypothetical protein
MLLTRNAGKGAAPDYQRHQPEQTRLYQIIEEYYPEFKARLEANGRTLPRYVQREFEDFLTCGRLEYGLLRVRLQKQMPRADNAGKARQGGVNSAD